MTMRRLLADRSGNFGLLTALLAVPLIGSAGMAIDFGHAMSLRTQLYAAADAAASSGAYLCCRLISRTASQSETT